MTQRPCPEISAAGSPFDRGHAHGEQARSLIETGVASWRTTLEAYADGDVDAYLERFLADTSFLDAITVHTPALIEEVDGLAAGSGVDPTVMLAYQLMDEQWCYEHRGRPPNPPEHRKLHKCSGIGLRTSGGTVVSQNMDLPDHFDGTQVVLRTPDALIFTAAGLIATNGMNADGVGVCVNSLLDRGSAPSGLPVAFVVRGILERGTGAEAAAFVRDVPHASGQNYLIGDATSLHDLEAGADGVDDIDTGAMFVHTNHSLARPSEDDPESYARDHHMDVSGLTNSVERRRFLMEAPVSSADDVERALSDRTTPICRIASETSRWMTFGSVVMELTDAPVMRVAPGPPTEAAYRSYRF